MRSFHGWFNDTVEGMTAGITGTAHTVNAATVMGMLPGRPRLLALGEPTHGEDVLLELRNDLFRRLVEQERYRTIAIESDCMLGLSPWARRRRRNSCDCSPTTWSPCSTRRRHI